MPSFPLILRAFFVYLKKKPVLDTVFEMSYQLILFNDKTLFRTQGDTILLIIVLKSFKLFSQVIRRQLARLLVTSSVLYLDHFKIEGSSIGKLAFYIIEAKTFLRSADS